MRKHIWVDEALLAEIDQLSAEKHISFARLVKRGLRLAVDEAKGVATTVVNNYTNVTGKIDPSEIDAAVRRVLGQAFATGGVLPSTPPAPAPMGELPSELPSEAVRYPVKTNLVQTTSSSYTPGRAFDEIDIQVTDSEIRFHVKHVCEALGIHRVDLMDEIDEEDYEVIDGSEYVGSLGVTTALAIAERSDIDTTEFQAWFNKQA